MSLLRTIVRRHALCTLPLRSSCASAKASRHPVQIIRPTLLPQRLLSTTTPRPQGPNVQEVTGTQAQESGAAGEVEAPDYLSEGELHVFNKLKQELEPTKLEVQDVSGGCGSMYGLDIVSSKFAGLSVIKQHQLVNKVLKDEISKWHGVQLKTKAP